MMTLPLSISVLVPTYGRTRVLGECIQSFLQQQGSIQTEMIVLNDHPEQEITVDPTSYDAERPVTVVNAGKRFADLGTKRNALLGMAALQYVWFWDDDDIYLPNALERFKARAAVMPDRFRTVRESHCWQAQQPGFIRGVSPAVPYGNHELVVRDGGPMWTMAIERAAILELGGFAAWDRCQDIDMASRLVHAHWVRSESNTPGIPSCIHRLAGTPYVHAVDYKGPANNPASSAFHAAATSALMDLGEEPRGPVCINPLWREDYVALTKRAWTAHIPDRVLPRHGEPASG